MRTDSEKTFFALSRQAQKRLFWLAGLVTVLLLWVLGLVDKPLRTAAAPNGIVSFELAHSFLQSQKILASWDATAKLYAAFSLGLDYLFLVSYGLFLAWSVWLLAKRFGETNRFRWVYRLGLVLAGLQILAAVLDAFENGFLIRLLFGAQNPAFSAWAFYCASFKFLFVFLGIIYILLALLALLVLKRRLE